MTTGVIIYGTVAWRHLTMLAKEKPVMSKITVYRRQMRLAVMPLPNIFNFQIH